MDELAELVEYSPQPILVADDARTITRANAPAAGLFDRPIDALVGASLDGLFQTTDGSDVSGSFQAVREGEGPCRLGEQTDVCARGGEEELVPVDITLDAVDVGTGDAAETRYVVSLSESSERERRIDELQSSEERYRRLLDAAPAPIVLFDADGEIRYANEAVAELLCVTDPEAMVGEAALSYVHPDERAASREKMQRVLEGCESIEGLERRLVTGDGETRHTVLTAVPVTGEDERTGQVVISDITAIKERERALERQNERLDRFASIVSHDLRNPLSVVRSSLEVLSEVETGEQAEHVERGLRAVDRMDRLLADLLTLARHGEIVSDTAPVPLSDVATLAWQTVETGDAKLLVGADGTVEADEGRLQELLENLFRNAVEHGSSPRSHAPEDAPESGDAPLTVTVDEFADGFYVADDGAGIPAAEREAVLEGGYSTSEDGTGLGLAIVAEIAHAHGWGVAVTESDWGGARFEFETA